MFNQILYHTLVFLVIEAIRKDWKIVGLPGSGKTLTMIFFRSNKKRLKVVSYDAPDVLLSESGGTEAIRKDWKNNLNITSYDQFPITEAIRKDWKVAVAKYQVTLSDAFVSYEAIRKDWKS